MTDAQDERIFKFFSWATFGCIENPSCYTCSARNLANDLGLDGDQMLEDLSDKIQRGVKGKSWRSSQPDTIRWIHVRKWISSRL